MDDELLEACRAIFRRDYEERGEVAVGELLGKLDARLGGPTWRPRWWRPDSCRATGMNDHYGCAWPDCDCA